MIKPFDKYFQLVEHNQPCNKISEYMGWGMEGDRDPHLWSLRSNGNIQTRGRGGQPGQTDLYSDQTPSYEKLSRTGPGPHRIPASFKIVLTNIQEIRDWESVQRRTQSEKTSDLCIVRLCMSWDSNWLVSTW